MARILAEFRVEGIRKILRALAKEDPIYAEPWTNALREATSELADRTHNWVPKGTGRMEASIRTKLQARPVPLWGKVQMQVARGGVRYGGILHGSRRIRYHYRHGPHAGDLTLGWLDKPKNEVLARFVARLGKVAAEIERRWARLT